MSGKDLFIENLRLAVGIVSPTVHVEGTGLDARQTAARLRRAALWLTPKAVEGFEPSDFDELSTDDREKLAAAVARFRDLANSVPGDSPATDEQYRVGLDLLDQIVSAVRGLILDDWKRSVGRLLAEAESWARKQGWDCRRKKEQLREKLLDSYELDSLMIGVNGTTLAMAPIARFVAGAEGVVDLSVVPSYDSLPIPRDRTGWYIQFDGLKESDMQREPWGEDAFVRAVESLRKKA